MSVIDSFLNSVYQAAPLSPVLTPLCGTAENCQEFKRGKTQPTNANMYCADAAISSIYHDDGAIKKMHGRGRQ